MLPELSVGDWLLFTQAGAYSLGQPLLTSNDSTPPPVYYTISSRDWQVSLMNVGFDVTKQDFKVLFSSFRFEMQESGATQDNTLKNFSVIPYCLSSCETEAALSVPA